MQKTFTVTRDWIFKNQTKRKAWTRRQLAILAVSWPPPRGWMYHAKGRIIDESDRVTFESDSGNLQGKLTWECDDSHGDLTSKPK